MTDFQRETRVDFQSGFARNFFADDRPGFDVRIAAATHPGKRRQKNEDHYAVIRRTRKSEILATNLPDDRIGFVDDHAWGILVADGIGGARCGDIASRMAIETALQAASQATSWVMKYTDMDAQELRQRVDAYIERIQESFQDHARLVPDAGEMGTTLTCAYLVPPHVIITQIGDSRAYLYRDQTLIQLTRDQTLAEALRNMGAAQDGIRRFSNVLVNSLGAGRQKVDADVIPLNLESGDRLLVCSDGLSDMAAHATIESAMATEDLQSCCRQLVADALEGGGKDNITVVICEMQEQETAPESDTGPWPGTGG